MGEKKNLEIKKIFDLAVQNHQKNNFKSAENFYNEVLKIINDLNIPIIDIKKEVFDKMKDPLELFPFKGQGHYNVKGYEIITKSIFNKINELEN